MAKRKYKEIELAILDEHEIKDEDGNILLNLTPEILQKIADNNNKRIKETGDEVPVVVGHTKQGLNEKDQPEILGYAKNFKVKQFFNTGRKAIFATHCFPDNPALLERVKKFPRRSVELWYRRLLIDPISLLGASTPDRSLGLLRFAQGGPVVSFLSPNEDQMDENKLKEIVQSVLEESDVFQWARSQMDAGGEEEGMEDPMADIGGAPDPMAAMAGAGAGDPAGASVVPEEEEEEGVAKMAAGSASGTSTSLPEFDKVRMQRDQAKGEVLKLQAQYKKAFDIAAELRIENQRIRREKDLVQMQAEGFVFDIAEELEDMAPLNEAAYQKQLVKLRKNYPQAPVDGPGVIRLSAETAKSGPSNKKEEMDRIVDFAFQHKLSYQEAVAQLKASATQVY